MDFLDELNNAQREAVLNTEGASLVIAGAGSGKTRVLTYRIAELLKKGISPYSILALTFTNKAAKEMLERISAIAGIDMSFRLWMGTFHSIFSKILRIEAEHIGYTSNYIIYDTQDAKNLIKSIVKELSLDDKRYKPGEVMGRISMAKNNLITPEAYIKSTNIQTADIASKKSELGTIYRYYQDRCRKNDAMDFDDLLMNTNILFRDFPDVLDKYRDKFQYVLIDEYQDTNYSQYLIVKRLAEKHNNICVVGDDAQSIYSFRGARIENILNFQKDYPEYKLFKLEQNYRSTDIIVNAANSVISKNKNQIPKALFSENKSQNKIIVRRSLSDKEEGYEVSREISRIINNDKADYKDFAILYRTNMQSRIIEETLRRYNIPYKVYGGQSFYQRAEIKNALAYIRLSVNNNDDEALKRIINYPRRGIGLTTFDKVLDISRINNISILEAISDKNRLEQVFNKSTANKLHGFHELISSFTEKANEEPSYDAANYIILKSGINDDLSLDSSPEGISRKENIQELLNAAKSYGEICYKENTDDKLSGFIEGISLMTDMDKDNQNDGSCVTLMTIHASKGLEFPYVFITGVEENLFPSAQSLYSPDSIEEERRLFYVAMTRAMKGVNIHYAATRYKNGEIVQCSPSRFIKDIDAKYLEGNNSTKFERDTISKKDKQTHTRIINKPIIKNQNLEFIKNIPDELDGEKIILNIDDVEQGMIVEHPTFGIGKIAEINGLGANKKARICFKSGDIKIILLKYARLKTKK